MKTKEAASIAISFIAFIVSLVTFSITISVTMEFTEIYRFLFSLFMGIFGFAAMIVMSFGYIKSFKPLAYRVRAGIESIFVFHDLPHTLLDWFAFIRKRARIIGLNASMKRAFKESMEKEPLIRTYDGFLHLRYEVDPGAKSMSIELTKDRAIARIPSTDADTIVNMIERHIQENLSKTSSVKDIKKLQKSLDLVVATLILRRIGMDGALTMALNKMLATVFRDADTRHLYNALMQINEQLKKKTWLDKTLLRTILVETYNYEMSERR